MANKNIEYDHACHEIVYRLFFIFVRVIVVYEYWLVGCFGFNSPLRQYFSLYRAISQREGERGENE